jgi:pyruvate dehydrogenase E2 component (dihydrolipoamide acetyltransferase)
MAEICMPSLGAEMEEGTVLQWYVEPGDQVEYGQIIALLDTEKAEIEMESFEIGWIDTLLVQTGETVPVGTPMATVRFEAQASAERPSDSAATPAATPATTPATRPAPTLAPTSPPERHDEPAARLDRRVRATPLARRIARQRGIELENLSGSGPDGAIVEADVLAADDGLGRADSSSDSVASREASQAPSVMPSDIASAKPDRAVRRRQVIAAAMERSKREIPHYYLATTIELTPALAWLENANVERPISERLLFPALLLKAVANAARRFPQLNGHWIDGTYQPAAAVHVGMVVSLRSGGIVVPTLRDADSRSLGELMAQLRDVVTRARVGRLRSAELSDATLAVTSLGEEGVETIYGVIYPPQVSIVGFGAIHSEVRAEGDLLGTRPVLRATLAADHRASDGQEGSRFLSAIARQLSEPEKL